MTQHAKLLDVTKESLEVLERIDCQFWACKGPDVPREHMVTCIVCQQIQNLRTVIAKAEK